MTCMHRKLILFVVPLKNICFLCINFLFTQYSQNYVFTYTHIYLKKKRIINFEVCNISLIYVQTNIMLLLQIVEANHFCLFLLKQMSEQVDFLRLVLFHVDFRNLAILENFYLSDFCFYWQFSDFCFYWQFSIFLVFVKFLQLIQDFKFNIVYFINKNRYFQHLHINNKFLVGCIFKMQGGIFLILSGWGLKKIYTHFMNECFSNILLICF
eukprot:TRINITY_DN2408_c0_g1_i1.p3 TRINITY_DN2408_c0_g1~~TRINITY_DN2408_c0_g1_i1.p3  ORF type:complete len:211 (+),score=-10.69 TRINITY_DN2408_c0_g1_i1:509-1141(+)